MRNVKSSMYQCSTCRLLMQYVVGETQETRSTETSEWFDVTNYGGVSSSARSFRGRAAWRCNIGPYWQVLSVAPFILSLFSNAHIIWTVSLLNVCISRVNVEACIWCDENFYTPLVGNLLAFPAMEEFWESIKILQSYCQNLTPRLFETQYGMPVEVQILTVDEGLVSCWYDDLYLPSFEFIWCE